MIFSLLALQIFRLGKRNLVCMLFVHLFVLRVLVCGFSSSSRCQGLAATFVSLYLFLLLSLSRIHVRIHLQLTLVISTSLISNNRLSRSENLVPA